MDTEAFQAGVSELNLLALAEYREPLAAVLSDADPQRSAVRIGRLVGVLLKEPFAVPQTLTEPSHRTVAYRAWHLVPPDEFVEPNRTGTWQHQALLQMKQELVSDDPYLAQMTEYDFAEYAQHEIGFFGFFARTLQKYICGDPAIRKKVDVALKNAGRTEKKIPVLTPEMVVGAGGFTVGVALVQSVPIMGIVGAPVIAAAVVILYTLGVDAFCGWSAQLRTDEDEKQ